MGGQRVNGRLIGGGGGSGGGRPHRRCRAGGGAAAMSDRRARGRGGEGAWGGGLGGGLAAAGRTCGGIEHAAAAAPSGRGGRFWRGHGRELVSSRAGAGRTAATTEQWVAEKTGRVGRRGVEGHLLAIRRRRRCRGGGTAGRGPLCL